ncbi:MAG: hypothetical protein GY862_31475, partial [Gammaproteobacteria bacterium]|nr:hypothetical protein [Gammaproteobacteria bacterium]
LFTVLFGGMIYAYIQIFKFWTGRKSLAQHEQEENREAANVLRDIALLLSLKRENREKLAPYREDADQYRSILEKPETLAWHERVRQLWLLRNRGYLFESQYDPAHKCWLGEEKNTGTLVLLACFHEAPSDDILTELAEYARKIADKQAKTEIELIAALKNADPPHEENFPDYRLKYTSEAVLLQDLVDFSDYFADIRYRVERAKLVDSDLTLHNTYTPSFYRLEKEVQDNSLEDFIRDWLRDNSRRQLALLGEYGQGKSTGSLLLSYHLIRQAETDHATRIPILIELRGKTLRTLPPEELLATWAYRYRIDAQALLHLHIAGRLLLIFEGFDEIDLSGDTEARVSHFRSLWRLNYDQAKIIITGRPNFFLDSKELKRALGTEEQTRTLNLAPFNLEQISNSLRAVDEQTRTEILALAERDTKFQEVVARPSLLYIVAVLWQHEKLSQRRHINSALVIDLFIRKTLERQQDKHDERPFMVLNSAERHYFMAGIAAYMAAKGLPNQIDIQQLEEAVRLLVAAVPEAVSQSVSTVGDEDSRPLRNEARLEWQTRRAEIMHKINTDVRSCGLLVTDLSKDGAFKFAHKSYMELLQAQVISQLLAADEVKHISGGSIANTWKLKIENLQDSDEAIGFLAELLKERLHEQGVSEDLAMAKGLWEILVIDKFSPQHTFYSFILSKWILAVIGLTGWLVSRFGIENRRGIGRILSLGAVAVVVAVIVYASTGAFIETGVFVVTIAVMVAAACASIGIGAATGAIVGAGTGVGIVASKVAGFVVGIVVGIFSIAGTLAIAGTVELKYGWMALLSVSAYVSVLISSVVDRAIDFLSLRKKDAHPTFNRLCLWYRACRDLRLPLGAIEKIVGKGMAALLAEAEEWRRR